MLQTETKKDNRKRFFDLEVLEQDLAKYRLQKDMVRLQIDILKILKKEALAHLFRRRFFLWDRERKSELEIEKERDQPFKIEGAFTDIWSLVHVTKYIQIKILNCLRGRCLIRHSLRQNYINGIESGDLYSAEMEICGGYRINRNTNNFKQYRFKRRLCRYLNL